MESSPPQDNHLTSILDSIIARVVERKIQQQQAGGEMSPPSASDPRSPRGPPVSHCILAPSGLLWLQDSGHAARYELFQEHWRQGEVSPLLPRDVGGHHESPQPHPGPPEPPLLPRQPVLVSGLQKRLEERLWGPESFRSCGMEQVLEVVNLRAPEPRIRVSSREFWDGFTASAGKWGMSLWASSAIPEVGSQPAHAPLPAMCPASRLLHPCVMLCSLPAASPEMDQGSGDLLKLESGFGDMEPCR